MSSKVIEHPGEDETLAFVHRFQICSLPHARFVEDGSEHLAGLVDRASEATQKPVEPWGDIRTAPLLALKLAVISLPLRFDLG